MKSPIRRIVLGFLILSASIMAMTSDPSGYTHAEVASQDSDAAKNPDPTQNLTQDDKAFAIGADWGEDEYATAVGFGDVDGDGLDEFGVTRKSEGGFRYWIYDDEEHGFLPLLAGGEDWVRESYASNIAIGDLDGDDLAEIAIVQQGDDSADLLVLDDANSDYRVLLSGLDDVGGLNAFDWHLITDVAFGDVDDDGLAEVAISGTYDILNVETWTETILFGTSRFLDGYYVQRRDRGKLASSVAFGNVDDDYPVEFGISLGSRTGLDPLYRFMVWDDERFFTLLAGSQSIGWPRNADATSIAFGDVDGDGRDELGVTRESAGENTTFIIYDDAEQGFVELYRSNAPFVRGPEYATATSIAFGDVDGDGLDEIAIGHVGPDPNILFNCTNDWDRPDFWVLDDARHGYQEMLAKGDTDWCYGDPTSVAFGDIDGDGMSDLGIGFGAESSTSRGDRASIYKVADFATVRVIIEEVHGVGDIDDLTAPDFYPVVVINGQRDSRREIDNERHIIPNWTFSEQAHLVPNVGVNIAIWDEDGGLNFKDNLVDISPIAGDGEGDQTLNLIVELEPCLVRHLSENGDESFACDETITMQGNDNPNAIVKFRVESTSVPARDVDLVAQGLEVTQAIQDLENSVRLVEGKRTFVRLHTFARKDTDASTTARLFVRRAGTSGVTALDPIHGTESIKVATNPRRDMLTDSFLWELPSEFTSGEVEMWAEVNPITEARSRHPIESDYDNNTASASVRFETVPTIDITMVLVGLGDRNNPDYPPEEHITKNELYLESLFPVSEVNVASDTYVHGGKPNCAQVNLRLRNKVVWDTYSSRFTSADPSPGSRRYLALTTGLKDDTGCASGIPSFTASSTDSGNTNHAAHELGHAYGEYHLEVCDADAGWWIFDPWWVPDYPYADGHISSDFSTRGFYGLDDTPLDDTAPVDAIPRVIPPYHYDLMGYCHPRWISDFRYERLMNYLQSADRAADVSPAVDATVLKPHIVVVSSIHPLTFEVEFEPLFVLPDVPESTAPRTGDFAIVLFDRTGLELARYPFDPSRMADEDLWAVTELVPYVDGTGFVVIEGPPGALVTIPVSPNSPTISVGSPVTGVGTNGDAVRVSWTATDADGDALSFVVQYSSDNGETWKTVAPGVTDSEIEIRRQAISAGEQAMFRVWVSDGINTAVATSPTISVRNLPPTTQITSPESGMTIAAKQVLSLRGDAYDVDDGSLEADNLQWRSNIDGLLGNGEDVTVTGLSEGQHRITFTARDSHDAESSASIIVTVVRDITRLPDPEDALVAGPDTIVFNPRVDLDSGIISIRNQNPTRSIRWQASVDQDWVKLAESSGNTPHELLVTFEDPGSLRSGENRAVIAFTSPDLPGYELMVNASVMIPWRFIYMPIGAKLPGPDIVVEAISINSDGHLEISIKNIGTLPTTYPFWVDLYVDPDPVPMEPNDIWADGRSRSGLVWHIDPYMQPGESTILTIGDANFRPLLSRVPGVLPRGTVIYVQVDSANTETTFGGVHEMHEVPGSAAPYNNIMSIVLENDTALSSVGVSTELSELSNEEALPLRPLHD